MHLEGGAPVGTGYRARLGKQTGPVTGEEGPDQAMGTQRSLGGREAAYWVGILERPWTPETVHQGLDPTLWRLRAPAVEASYLTSGSDALRPLT